MEELVSILGTWAVFVNQLIPCSGVICRLLINFEYSLDLDQENVGHIV